jgi:hypothetical protein
MSATTEVRLPRRKLAQWLRWERKRLKFARQAKDMAALQEPLEKELDQLVRQHGGPAKALANSEGWRVFFKGKRKSVEWKPHFILAKGEKGSEEAEKIIAAQPMEDVLVIEPPPGALEK